MPEELSRTQSILRFDIILQHDWPIEQCLLHIRVFFGGKTKSPCFDLFIHWLIKQITNTYRNHFSRSYENCSIQFIKPVAFLVQWPTHGEGIGGVPTLIYPLDNCFETEIITTEHACIFEHCSFKTSLVAHVLIKALVEIKEKCMAGGEWGVSPLLQKSNFCETKRPNNFCNINRRDVDRLSNNDQLFRF